MRSERQRFARHLAVAVLATAGALVVAAAANAHFAGFTSGGDDDYFCTLSQNQTCRYDGDTSGCFSVGCEIHHSYGFQSVGNQQTTDRTVATLICNPSSCFDDFGTNFRRLCWPPWGVDLECHDQEGVTHTVLIQNRSAASGVLKSNPWW
jgi:hypothetical protein